MDCSIGRGGSREGKDDGGLHDDGGEEDVVGGELDSALDFSNRSCELSLECDDQV